MLPKSVDGGNFGPSAAVIGRMPVENGEWGGFHVSVE